MRNNSENKSKDLLDDAMDSIRNNDTKELAPTPAEVVEATQVEETAETPSVEPESISEGKEPSSEEAKASVGTEVEKDTQGQSSTTKEKSPRTKLFVALFWFITLSVIIYTTECWKSVMSWIYSSKSWIENDSMEFLNLSELSRNQLYVIYGFIGVGAFLALVLCGHFMEGSKDKPKKEQLGCGCSGIAAILIVTPIVSGILWATLQVIQNRDSIGDWIYDIWYYPVGALVLWIIYISMKEGSKCSNCGKEWAYEVVHKDFDHALDAKWAKDINGKLKKDLLDNHYKVQTVYYKVLYKCKHCGHQYIKTEKKEEKI